MVDVLSLAGVMVDAFDVVAAAYNQTLIFAQTGTGRDEVTADYVLLHTLECVGLAGDCRFVENLGGFLERSCRDEAGGLQCGTCDTLEYLFGSSGHGITHGNKLEVAALQSRVLVAQLAGGDNLHCRRRRLPLSCPRCGRSRP